MRVLVDTSVWIDHLRSRNEELVQLLQDNKVLIHPAIIGELACGTLPKRIQFLEDLLLLPHAIEATSKETLGFIEQKKLYGKGLGWVDAQLLASAALSQACLMTLDKRLAKFKD